MKMIEINRLMFDENSNCLDFLIYQFKTKQEGKNNLVGIYLPFGDFSHYIISPSGSDYSVSGIYTKKCLKLWKMVNHN
jgi:hypothetical protein